MSGIELVFWLSIAYCALLPILLAACGCLSHVLPEPEPVREVTAYKSWQDSPLVDAEVEAIRLTLERLDCYRILSSREIEGAYSVEVLKEHLWDGFRVHFTRAIYAQQLETLEYPATWWDAFKARWFPCWILRHFPVEFTRWEAKALYPRLAHQLKPVLCVQKVGPARK